MIVTIDGVAASGKSSVASGVARALNIPYLSSGLLYRAATWAALSQRLPLTDAAPLLSLLNRWEADGTPLTLRPLPQGNEIWVGEQNVTDLLHTTEVDAHVSAAAQLPELRAWVDAQLHRISPPFVAEGRDMGTAVFPQAQAKFYLEASARVRAQRRVQERPQDLESVEAALRLRDERDARQSAPAPDAVHIDTGSGTLEQIIAQVLSHLPAPPTE
ncbi:(d)CMP kinase [Deinococcus ruber]|uniref:Cytidylate kinase n=1 Tax=Deinococcus ruber TaxID=1848197 RepID=A0A918C3R2_9DEIO|nr:(d)CMP kinase [Deinococcus ruber]GGR05057.1 cytidylate kinase [Deinococcus ruber]